MLKKEKGAGRKGEDDVHRVTDKRGAVNVSAWKTCPGKLTGRNADCIHQKRMPKSALQYRTGSA